MYVCMYVCMHCSQVAGRTKSAEAGEGTQTVNIFYTQPLLQIAVLGMLPEINVTQVMAIDKQLDDARSVTVCCDKMMIDVIQSAFQV